MKLTRQIILLCIPCAMASCGSKKALVQDSPVTTTASTEMTNTLAARKLAFVQKVSDQKVYAKNIVADLSFNAKMDDKSITVPGALRMRRDEVIRLQLFIPILGSEVGRIEFTPDYVLVIDRMHKQYIKGDYNQLSFLKDNGLNFYSLQSLFWNQLLLPGASKVGEADLQKFDVTLDAAGGELPVVLKNGNMSYVWKADKNNGRISEAEVSYDNGPRNKSDLVWKYSDFKALGAKQFPATQEFSFSTTATNKLQTTTVKLKMNELSTSEDWETQSTVSSRYKQMDAKDIFGQLLNM